MVMFLPSFSRVCFGFLFCFGLCTIGFSKESSERDLKVMSFNVRLFNSYNWIEEKNIPESIVSFINQESPDIHMLL